MHLSSRTSAGYTFVGVEQVSMQIVRWEGAKGWKCAMYERRAFFSLSDLAVFFTLARADESSCIKRSRNSQPVLTTLSSNSTVHVHSVFFFSFVFGSFRFFIINYSSTVHRSHLSVEWWITNPWHSPRALIVINTPRLHSEHGGESCDHWFPMLTCTLLRPSVPSIRRLAADVLAFYVHLRASYLRKRFKAETQSGVLETMLKIWKALWKLECPLILSEFLYIGAYEKLIFLSKNQSTVIG